MILRSTWLVGCAALGAVACSATPATPPSSATVASPSAEAGTAAPSPRVAEPAAAAADDGSPVPAPVAELHRTVFEPSEKPVPGGKVECLVTVHDGRLSHGQFHAVALFAGGFVATWTQSPSGRVEPFLAKLTPDEDAQARGWLEEIARRRGSARDRFPPSATVLGISTQPGDGVETAYFASGETPAPLDRLVRLLKHRLEARNAP